MRRETPFVRAPREGGDSDEPLTLLRLLLQPDATVERQEALLERFNGRIPNGDELADMAALLREQCVRVEGVPPEAVDLCGTGGDRAGTFNISTAAAFVAAGAGAIVVKHGNRAVTSRSGSTDCLAALGVGCPTSAAIASQMLRELGIVFLSAPAFHPALAAVAEARRRLRDRGQGTVFNLLGPLVNPGFVRRQALGVFRPDLIDPMVHALRRLGVERAMVFHGDGLDEITLTGTTHFAMLGRTENFPGEPRAPVFDATNSATRRETSQGSARAEVPATKAAQTATIRHADPTHALAGRGVYRGTLEPERLGLRRCEPRELAGGDARKNAAITRGILKGRIRDARRDVVLLSAAAALVVSDDNGMTLLDGLRRARESLESGAALAKLELLRRTTHA